MKQTRQAVRTIKQSIFLDVYGLHLVIYSFKSMIGIILML
jgi:hypothetical protein